MTTTALLLVAGGLALLFAGGEILVRGASRLAVALGLSPLIVGLTVVAFSTSAPELAVTVRSALQGDAGLALGNVVGSNIANVLLILGLAAVIAPLRVDQKLIRWDVPLMIAASAGVWLLAGDGVVGRGDGLALVLGIAAYIVFSIRQSRGESAAVQQEYQQEYGPGAPVTARQWVLNAGLVLGGIGLLILGAGWLVEGAVSAARWLGLSDLVIGLTIVAVGTSLPELATSVIATLRGERDIAVGNVVGSNIFNSLSVLGLTALAAPRGVPVAAAALNFDLPVMLAVAAACLPIFFNGFRIERWEGLLFLGYYIAYTAYLLLGAAQHDALPVFSAAMLWFVIPLTLITLGVVLFRAWRR